MSPKDRVQVGEYWLALASMYGKEIQPQALKLMLDAVSDLSGEDVLRILSDWPKVSKRREHPLPSDIREQIQPEPTNDAKGRELLGRLQEAVRKFGYLGAVVEVEKFVGPEGAQIIRERGGWHSLCVDQDIFDPFVASQIRDRAKDLVQYKDSIREFEKLEAPKGQGQMESKGKAFLLDFVSKTKTIKPMEGV